MSERRVRWGILSTANIGRRALVPAIRTSGNGELVAVASREHERARAFATENGVSRHHGSYQALLDDPEVDAVYLPLPNSMHREWTIRAAEAGKHVLCEKPLALDADECLEMHDAAESRGVRLMEAFMYRFHPRTRLMADRIRAGAVGELRVIRSAFTFPLDRPHDIRFDRALGGGSLMDVGCYCVNLSRTLADAEPLAVRATARWTGGYMGGGPGTAVDDEMAGVLHFPGGVTALFDCALTMARTEFAEVAGTDGRLRMESAFAPGTQEVALREFSGRAGAVEHRIPGVDEYRLMVEHFGECVLEDRPPRYSAREAAANMRVISALYRSAINGGAVVELDSAGPM